MRPVRRNSSPRGDDLGSYRQAYPELVSRLGPYCNYCERKLPTSLAVEHIRPKGLPQYADLEGRWENFLLACIDCNSTEGDKDVDPAAASLPDRDNTFIYSENGSVVPAAGPAFRSATAPLELTGLNKPVSTIHDANGRLVVLDRVSQRAQAWQIAMSSKDDIDTETASVGLRRSTTRTAVAEGFFSIWMTVFAGDPDMRNRPIHAFPGIHASGCFDPITFVPIFPAPNPDGLPHGGKL
jgi:hypothetical protein